MNTINNQYSVNYIHGEQNRASIAIQCTNLLQHLDDVMDEIFNSILVRINDNSTKVKALHNRAKIAQAKVEKLRERSNATQVFSSAVYPGKDVYTPFKGLEVNNNLEQKFVSNGKSFDPPEYNSSLLKDKLDFFHVHDHRKRVSPLKSSRSAKGGLGRLPPHLTSVSSLLLYNTTHNPYNEYMLLDPLGVISGTRGDLKTDEGDANIHEAPVSIKEGDQGIQIAKDEFQYLPDLSNLPELDLPLELPSLPGIANDLAYEADESPSIAPSMGLPDLPLFESVSSLSSPSNPPPPPPPISEAKSVKEPLQVISNQPSKSEISYSSPLPSEIPPPPPPPPPPQPQPKEEEEVNTVTPPKPEAIPIKMASNSRSSLMKAIQEAGGAGKAKLRKVAEKKEKQKPKPVIGGGDLMSDLFAKLSQRRKGISGNVSAAKTDRNVSLENEIVESSTGQSTMQKIASIIPPPIASNTDSDTRQSDDDWE